MPGPDGVLMHAEMELSDGVIMMGCPGPEFLNPTRHGHVSQIQYVYVDDVDKYFERAKGAGAKILAEPEDQFYGDRRYAVEDLAGHHGYFAQHVRDVAPLDIHP